MTKDHQAFKVGPSIPFRLLSKQEMAELLGYTTRTIDRMVAANRIPFTRIPTGVGFGTRVKFDSREIEKWLEQIKVDAIDAKEKLRELMSGW